MIKQLDLYDFDETLVRVPSYTSKKAVELVHPTVKFEHPYEFYDHPTSLCEELHHIQLIGPVYDCWREAAADANTLTALVTHRVVELEDEVKRVLSSRGVVMDRYFFCGRITPKSKVLEVLLQEFPTVEKVRIFDDSYAQLGTYLEYIAKTSSQVEYEIWAVDRSKLIKIVNLQLGESKRIVLI